CAAARAGTSTTHASSGTISRATLRIDVSPYLYRSEPPRWAVQYLPDVPLHERPTERHRGRRGPRTAPNRSCIDDVNERTTTTRRSWQEVAAECQGRGRRLTTRPHCSAHNTRSR